MKHVVSDLPVWTLQALVNSQSKYKDIIMTVKPFRGL